MGIALSALSNLRVVLETLKPMTVVLYGGLFLPCVLGTLSIETQEEIMGRDPGGEEDMPLGLGLHFHDKE